MFEVLFADAPEGSLVEFAFGVPPNSREWQTPGDAIGRTAWPSTHCFFGPAVRSSRGSTKADCLAARVLWVDIDSKELPRPTLPATFVVWSGHGWHLYWCLDRWITDPDLIEGLNKVLVEDVDGDKACTNVNRLLRVPETPNEDSRCEIRKSNPGTRYEPGDFDVLRRLDRKAKHKIRTGDSRGYKSRSERDWSVITSLVAAGASDRLIGTIFKLQPVGDKLNEAPAQYLEHTIEKARAKQPGGGANGVGANALGIEEKEDGYYAIGGRRERRISTFTLDPILLLDGHDYGAEDAIVTTVHASGYTWPDTTFTRSAFTGLRAIDRETPIAAWQWIGRDEDVRALLPYLMDRLREKGLPRTRATSVLGLHDVGGSSFFVGSSHTIGADETFEGHTGPLVYLAPRREHPVLDLRPVDDEARKVVAAVGALLPRLNKPETLWPIVGWYFATPFKPILERYGLRFPILNVHGTKGSGKTTVIQRVMMPLLGQVEPKSYDANTTRFVILSVLGSTNAVPVAFSEFRFGSADKFLRYVLLSYDSGHDPRGRADQTTVDYPLTAPFSVDGEDLIADPAAKERIVAVTMHPADIGEGTDAYDAFREIRELPLHRAGGYYLRRCLRLIDDGECEARIKRARDDIFAAYPEHLPDRVRNNYTVAWFGIGMFCAAFGGSSPLPTVLSEALRVVFDSERGRAFVAADEMVADLCNAIDGGTHSFPWDYDAQCGVVYFQFRPGYNYWLALRRRTNQSILGEDALRTQLKEVEYIVGPTSRGHNWMYGVNLAAARKMGLDVPEKMSPSTLEVHF